MKTKIVEITNIQELLNDLSSIYADLRSGAAKPNEVKEINNTAGKIIGSCKVALEYSNARKEIPNIPFLNISKIVTGVSEPAIESK